MHFYYLVAAYNEATSLNLLVEKFNYLQEKKVNFSVIVIDNASDDNTRDILASLKIEHSWLHSIHINEKGLGLAFKAGLNYLASLKIEPNNWVVFTAADLPFAFSDYEQVLIASEKSPACSLFVGSKKHPNSKIQRDLKRKISSNIFFLLRYLFLNLKTKDTQGTVFMKSQYISIVEKIQARDYFFTTELIYFLHFVTEVIEVPIIFERELRPSKVNVLKDGYKSLVQLVKLRFR